MDVTDQFGMYLFDNLDPNTCYVVFFDIPAAYTFTTTGAGAGAGNNLDSDVNSNGFTDSVCLGENDSNLTVDAGVIAPCINEPTYICTNPIVPLTICPTFCNLSGPITIPYTIVSAENTSFSCSVEIEGDCIDFIALPLYEGIDTITVIACEDANPNNCDEAIIIVTVVEDCDNPSIDPPVVDPPVVDPPCDNEIVTIQCIEPLQAVDICPDFCELPNGAYITNVNNLFDCSIEFGDTDNCFEYIPLPAFEANDTLTVTGCNPLDPTECYDVIIVVPVMLDCGVQSNNPSDEQFASNDNIAVNMNEAVLINATDNDDMMDGTWMAITSICGEPNNGYASVVNNQILYMSNEDFVGSDVVCYEVCNDYGCDQAMIYLNVFDAAATNEEVIANDDMAETEGNPVVVDVLENDIVEVADATMMTIVNDPANGSATINADGTISYMPEDNFTGVVSVTYVVCNDNNMCDEATIMVHVRTDMVMFDDLSIFPTPATDQINVAFTNDDEAEISLVIYNAVGQIMYEDSSTPGSGYHTINVPVAHFAKGMYVVSLTKNDESIVEKFLKD